MKEGVCLMAHARKGYSTGAQHVEKVGTVPSNAGIARTARGCGDFVDRNTGLCLGGSPVSRLFWWGTSRLEQIAQLLRVWGISFRFALRTSLRAPVAVSED